MKSKLLIFAVLLGSSGIVGVWVFSIAGKARVAATHSTVASLYAGLHQSMTLLNESELNWRILEDGEYRRTVAEVSRHVSIDAGSNGWKADGVLVDSWGNCLQIAIRKTDEGKLEYIVWSKGADGHSGTRDDIVVPHGAVALIAS